MEYPAYEIRRATPADAEAIAAAHLDSIRSIGPRHYDKAVVNDWAAKVKPDLYATAMANGETFYIALRRSEAKPEVIGFSSHRVEQGEHRTAIYVRGSAARAGAGSALFRAAEAEAIAAGARSIHVAASLAAVEFYRANGFEAIADGEHRLWPGRSMPCVFMRKELAEDGR